ncbi:MAG: lysophospholipid acyltransferase family protein [Victivallaceae bacterium]
MQSFKKKFRNIKKLPNWIFFILAVFLKCMARCLFRIKIEDPNNYIPADENFVVVIWHNRLLFMPAIFPKKARVRTKAVISASRDGQYIADIVHQFGLQTVRGSSSREGAKAQRGALEAIEENWHVVFTPDGPRGPKYHMHPGPIHLASNTNRRIVPVMINASRYWQLKSWDGFQIPKPFSKLTLIIGDATSIPQGISGKAELEKWRKITEEKLLAITKD